MPFESKYVERNWKSETRTSRPPRQGILATRNVLDTDGPIWAVPACMWSGCSGPERLKAANLRAAGWPTRPNGPPVTPGPAWKFLQLGF